MNLVRSTVLQRWAWIGGDGGVVGVLARPSLVEKRVWGKKKWATAGLGAFKAPWLHGALVGASMWSCQMAGAKGGWPYRHGRVTVLAI
jgi:hypothetical protein